MSIEEYEKLSEERPDLLKIIDGSIYYSFDYTDYLYSELKKRDNIINELEKDLKEASNCLVYNELVNGKDLINNISNDLKELKEKKDE